MIDSLNISGSALTAGRLRLDVVASNIANAETTRTADGLPYRRRTVLLTSGGSQFDLMLKAQLQRLPVKHPPGESRAARGVQVAGIMDDAAPFEYRHDPDHPDADENGYVVYPNVDLVREMTDLLMASRAYQANATAFNVTKNMISTTYRMGG